MLVDFAVRSRQSRLEYLEIGRVQGAELQSATQGQQKGKPLTELALAGTTPQRSVVMAVLLSNLDVCVM